MMFDLVHWAIVPVYAMTFFFAVGNLRLSTCKKTKHFHLIINWAIVVQSLSYIGLRLDWMLSDYGNNIGNIIDMIWLVYEYLVGLIILVLTMSAPHFINMDNK